MDNQKEEKREIQNISSEPEKLVIQEIQEEE